MLHVLYLYNAREIIHTIREQWNMLSKSIQQTTKQKETISPKNIIAKKK